MVITLSGQSTGSWAGPLGSTSPTHPLALYIWTLEKKKKGLEVCMHTPGTRSLESHSKEAGTVSCSRSSQTQWPTQTAGRRQGRSAMLPSPLQGLTSSEAAVLSVRLALALGSSETGTPLWHLHLAYQR